VVTPLVGGAVVVVVVVGGAVVVVVVVVVVDGGVVDPEPDEVVVPLEASSHGVSQGWGTLVVGTVPLLHHLALYTSWSYVTYEPAG